MSKIFKAKLRDEFTRIGRIDKVAPQVWQQNFVVNCQAVGNCQQSIRYLAAYVFKVAISNSRIIKVEDGKVWFRYKKPHSRRWRTMVLDTMEFMRLRRVYAAILAACPAHRLYESKILWLHKPGLPWRDFLGIYYNCYIIFSLGYIA